MRVVIVGAGHVGQTVLESLHESHNCTVIDLDAARLRAVSQAYDARVVEGDGAAREALQEAGIAGAQLVLACTSRDEANLVTAMLARRLSKARTVVRTTNMAYLTAWRERDLDVDFMVSSEFETANAIVRVIGVPGTRQADYFVNGRVQVLQFEVPAGDPPPAFCGRPLAEAGLPRESRVALIVRGGRQVRPRRDEALTPGDRVVVIASREAAREWSRLLVRDQRAVNDVAVFGGGRSGTAIAQVLLNRGIGVRLIEADAARARRLADMLPRARVFHATGLDREFLRRERIGRATAAIFATGDDGRNLHAAVLAKVHGVSLTMAILQEPRAAEVFDAAGVDVTVDPGAEAAEVMVRFAHDPRTRQVALLENERFQVLDVTVRAESPLCGRPLASLPPTSSFIGAVVRDGEVVFPRGDAQLRPGDRVIVLVEGERADRVERAL
jgi:trk system potassium uptake protein TrkA